MSKIKIYGNPNSRVGRITWCAQELGLSFEKVLTSYEETKKPGFLAVNPNGKLPAFADGDLNLFESLAINLYIAKKYGTGELYPTTIEDEARVFQWTLWAVSEVEPAAEAAFLVTIGYSKDEAALAAAPDKIKRPIMVLNGHLDGREWLVGKRFSVADLNVACVLNMARASNIDLSYAPNVAAWLDRCSARPARSPAF